MDNDTELVRRWDELPDPALKVGSSTCHPADHSIPPWTSRALIDVRQSWMVVLLMLLSAD